MDDAEATFAKVLKANAQDASALNGLGNIRAMRGDSDAAIEYYERATKLEPDYTYAWYDFALSLHEKYGQRSGKDLATLQKLRCWSCRPRQGQSNGCRTRHSTMS
jgi:tetratricopeptide (TPR) repeat protein